MATFADKARMLSLVFTDLTDSTALKTEKGDRAAGELIARHRGHVERCATETDGHIVDWAGDGCFLTFDVSSAAVLFALRILKPQTTRKTTAVVNQIALVPRHSLQSESRVLSIANSYRDSALPSVDSPVLLFPGPLTMPRFPLPALVSHPRFQTVQQTTYVYRRSRREQPAHFGGMEARP